MQFDKQKSARILIVDDEPLISLMLEEMLVDAGFRIAGVAQKIEKAIELIEGGACDAAIIDANLAGVSASPAASAMAARGLPFIVLSGSSRDQLQADFVGALFMQKPCREAQLIDALRTMCSNTKYAAYTPVLTPAPDELAHTTPVPLTPAPLV